MQKNKSITTCNFRKLRRAKWLFLTSKEDLTKKELHLNRETRGTHWTCYDSNLKSEPV
jgi:hypothetical protein